MSLNGIDISNYQSAINLSAVRPGFVIAKISEGTTFRDGSFDRFYNDCKNLGIPVGAYVYSHATSAERGRAEADYAIKLLKGRGLDLPIFLDIEADILNAGMSALMASALAFAETVKSRGYKAGVYASAYPFKTVLDADKLRENGVLIWCAAYNGGNTPPMDCDIWQYSNSGRLSGYSADLDLNRMYAERVEQGIQQDIQQKLYKADMSILCRGFYGTQVELYQCCLNLANYPCDVNGVFDKGTEDATKRFQKDVGLISDGIAGPRTMELLRCSSPIVLGKA